MKISREEESAQVRGFLFQLTGIINCYVVDSNCMYMNPNWIDGFFRDLCVLDDCGINAEIVGIGIILMKISCKVVICMMFGWFWYIILDLDVLFWGQIS